MSWKAIARYREGCVGSAFYAFLIAILWLFLILEFNQQPATIVKSYVSCVMKLLKTP